jgi:hypothetical protein
MWHKLKIRIFIERLKRLPILIASRASLEEQSPSVVRLMFRLLAFLHDKKVLASDFSKDIVGYKKKCT